MDHTGPKVILPDSKPVNTERHETGHIQSIDAEPIEVNEIICSDRDGRIRITNTDMWHYSVHGVVTMTFKGQCCRGTGTLIGPNLVLTAGHNLYSHKEGVAVDEGSIQFLPAINGTSLPFGSVRVKKHFVSEYVKNENEDYGLLVLDKPIGEYTGYFGCAILDPESIKSETITITGYPADKAGNKPRHYEMWSMDGKVESISADADCIYYKIDTYGGQSGSGVWYKTKDGRFCVIGVHVCGDTGLKMNKATLITEKRAQQIREWIKDDKVDLSDNMPPKKSKVKEEDQEDYDIHEVKQGDKLWDIADKYYENPSKYELIMTFNKLHDTDLRPGQKLKIPRIKDNSY